MENVTDLMVGIAAEHLVCADLILQGHTAAMAGQGFPYDVMAEINGRLYKVQVKASRTHKPVPQRKNYIPAYIFHIGKNGKDGRRTRYEEKQVDIFAVVALDCKQIGYLPFFNTQTTMNFRVPSLRGSYHNEQGEDKRTLLLKMKSEAATFKALKAALETSSTTIYKYLKGGAANDGGLKKGVYIADFTLEKCLKKIHEKRTGIK